MKRVLGLAIAVAALALPAHAQASKGAPPASAASPITSNNGSGGGGSSGFSGGGSVGGSHLSAYPRRQFGVASVSGTQQDYVPSTFVAYDQALAEGRDILSNPPKTVVEAAHAQVAAPAGKAKFAFVQNANGDAVIVVR